MDVTSTSLLAWSDGLAPGHARDDDGMLTIGGARAEDLVRAHRSPLLVLDLAVLDAAIGAMRAACDPHGVRISYGGKALLLTALARRLCGRGLGIDVCSLGELATAERAGVAPEHLTLHGAGKLDEELRAALVGRVSRIVVDSIAELRRLAAARADEVPLDVLLRLNTGIEAHTHEFVRTGGDDTKFGIAPHEESTAQSLFRASPHLRLRGLHSHIGSQIFEAAPFVANVEALVDASARFSAAGFTVDTLIAGGGFGIQTSPDGTGESLDIEAMIGAMAEAAREASARGLPVPTLEIEPGRSLIAHAGTSLYRVLAVKRYERRTFVIVDGSIADNPRPALYGAYHHVVAASPIAGEMFDATISGRSCENDTLGQARLPRDVREGDLLALCTTGAYTYSMASNYNRYPRPAVVAIENGEPRLFARRERIEEMLQNDVD